MKIFVNRQSECKDNSQIHKSESVTFSKIMKMFNNSNEDKSNVEN